MKCRSCNQTKPLDEFYKSNKHISGRKNTCKLCDKNKDRRHSRKIPGYIYVISNPAWDGVYKIGRTTTSPQHRLSTYQLYSPYRDYKVEWSVKVSDVYPFELWIDENYEKEQGEWYYGVLENIISDLELLVGSEYVLNFRHGKLLKIG